MIKVEQFVEAIIYPVIFARTGKQWPDDRNSQSPRIF